jgi:hypothetical protein
LREWRLLLDLKFKTLFAAVGIYLRPSRMQVKNMHSTCVTRPPKTAAN